MINQYAAWAIKDEIKSYFVDYRNEEVSRHIENVPIIEKIIKEKSKILGITYKKVIEYKIREIKFDYGFIFTRMKQGVVWNEYKVLCAIDDNNKIVYWKIEI